MEFYVEALKPPDAASSPVEIVERKGLGHPDTICDALAEEFSLALSRHYLEHFGTILHHNVDKLLLCAGRSTPAFGGGSVTQPIDVFLAGRATRDVKGVRVPVGELAVESCRGWVRSHLPHLDPEKHMRFHVLVGPGSEELVELYLRQERTGIRLANDTSCGCGYAPFSELEILTDSVERHLNADAVKRAHPELGEDIKVMGVRRGDAIHLTLAVALVDRFVRDIEDYCRKVENATGLAQLIAKDLADCPATIEMNTADAPADGSIYLTVTGTSAEAGDDGEAGRGNRVNGLITPYRPMTMESLAGKNPVTHVGKLYNLAAGLIAADILQCVPTATAAECRLVSQIGRPIKEPQLVDVGVRLREPGALEKARPEIESVIRMHLDGMDRYADELLTGRLGLDRWPLRQTPTEQDAA
jgi:S-adenosylmethionine synthetase